MTVNRDGCAALCVLFCISLTANVVSSQTPLSFSFMLARPVDNGIVEQDTSGVAPAVDLALQTINNDTTVLNGYVLGYEDELNSQCERTASLDAFFADITSLPNKVFLLGCGCSIATAPVGEISHFWEIVQMTYASLTPLITDRTAYPNLFSTLPSSLSYEPVIDGIMNAFGWNRLVVVTQMENEFTMLRDLLVNNANRSNEGITFNSDSNIADNPSLFNLDDDYRIYFLNMYEKHARRVLCQASQNADIRYPQYIFIVPGTYQERWWTVNDTVCTPNELMQTLNYSLAITTYPTAAQKDTPTDVGLTYEEFLSMYDTELELNDTLSSTFAAPFAYDAVWAIALAMNSATFAYPLSAFDNKMIGQRISKEIKLQLYNQSFIGVTGPVSFNSNGTRQESSPSVYQFRFNSNSSSSYDPVLIGTIVNATTTEPFLIYVNNETNDSVWPIIVPFDGSPLSELRAIVIPLAVYLYFITTVCIIFAVACSIVNFILRNRKVIRLTSPNLNHLIVLGCILMIFSTYCYAYPASHYSVVYTLCIIRAYTQNIGYMLCFGTICAKMGRVYFIFNNTSPSRKRRSIQDWHLLLIVLGLASIDIFILTVALALDPYKPTEVPYTEKRTDVNEYGITINLKSLVCASERSTFWIVVLFLTKFIVQAAAVFFAFTTRKVKIKVLNDAKIISIIIYVASALLTVLLITAIALSNFLNADAGVFGTGIIIVAVTVLLLLFIPKWRNLYKDPEGKNIFEGSSQQTFQSQPGGVSEQDAAKMVVRIEELESRLAKHEQVTPSQPRKRYLSSATDVSRSMGSTAGLLNRPSGGVLGGRSQSYSPTPLDVTASLPPKMPYSPGPVSPLSYKGGTMDSGAGTLNSTPPDSSDNSPLTNIPTFAIEEVDEPINQLTSSQAPLTASTNF